MSSIRSGDSVCFISLPTDNHFQKLPDDERMKEDKLLFDLLEQKGWVRCPQCGVSPRFSDLLSGPQCLRKHGADIRKNECITGAIGKDHGLSAYHVCPGPTAGQGGIWITS